MSPSDNGRGRPDRTALRFSPHRPSRPAAPGYFLNRGRPAQTPAFPGLTDVRDMIPIQPFSVKLSDEERVRLKEMSQLLGCTDGKAIRDALDAVYQLIHEPKASTTPQIVEIARLALRRKRNFQTSRHEKHD